jgi:hypothetical protein
VVVFRSKVGSQVIVSRVTNDCFDVNDLHLAKGVDVGNQTV